MLTIICVDTYALKGRTGRINSQSALLLLDLNHSSPYPAASSLDEVTPNGGFWVMISSIPLRYIAATYLIVLCIGIKYFGSQK